MPETTEQRTMRAPAKSFTDLVVWQKAHALVVGIYKATQGFPSGERFGLVSQMRRAAVSIPANIAEGFSRRGKVDRLRFMNMAEGSMEESRYDRILAMGKQMPSWICQRKPAACLILFHMESNCPRGARASFMPANPCAGA